MHDLRPDLSNLWRSTARLTSPTGGRAVMFVAARSGEGTTSVAASFAAMASARTPRAAWLVDLDLRRNAVFRGFEDGFGKGFGAPDRALDASLGEEPFYSITPKSGAQGAGSKLLSAHQIGGSRLLVTRFRNERLRQGQRVQIRTQPAWWKALRKISDWIVVDAPALDRSGAGLTVVSQLDGVVLVLSADQTTVDELSALRGEVEAHGGTVIGVVMNKTRADARLADRFGS